MPEPIIVRSSDNASGPVTFEIESNGGMITGAAIVGGMNKAGIVIEKAKEAGEIEISYDYASCPCGDLEESPGTEGVPGIPEDEDEDDDYGKIHKSNS